MCVRGGEGDVVIAPRRAEVMSLLKSDMHYSCIRGAGLAGRYGEGRVVLDDFSAVFFDGFERSPFAEMKTKIEAGEKKNGEKINEGDCCKSKRGEAREEGIGKDGKDKKGAVF